MDLPCINAHYTLFWPSAPEEMLDQSFTLDDAIAKAKALSCSLQRCWMRISIYDRWNHHVPCVAKVSPDGTLTFL